MYFTHLALCVFATLLFVLVASKPVNRGPPHPDPVENNSPDDKFDLGLHYEHYLKQVVEELERDSEFKKKLESANLTDIKNGNIATYLELVNHTIRSNLDELKRREIQRLRELSMQQHRNNVERFQIDHVDKRNLHSFGVEDLRALIKTATSDLEALDEQRRKEFKEHELEKEAHKRQKLEHLQGEERKREETHFEEIEKKHKDHPKMHHPGSKDQLEEVWEKSDHFEDQDFDPKTFFMKHDLDGDFQWSIEEVDSVLQVELDKVYDPNNPEEDDPKEREEEMGRMREHMMTEMDKDRNMFISLEEFLAYTGPHGENPDFKKDEGWKTIDEQDPVYTEQELEEYLKQFENEHGVVNNPPSQDLHFRPEEQAGHQQQFQAPPQQHQQFQPPQQQQHHQQQQQQHQQPNQPPQQHLSPEQLQQQVQELQQRLQQQQHQQQQQQQQHQQQQPHVAAQHGQAPRH